MRGTRVPGESRAAEWRFIPAHAGNTRCRSGCRRRPAVHPRACGEHGALGDRRCPFVGSSPRMRGTRARERAASCYGRFIPAHAGNTVSGEAHAPKRSVHPRACGEHGSMPTVERTASGSSPRMRGTRLSPAAGPRDERFIPAHAGNTWPPNTSATSRSVHPRACGEHASAVSLSSATCGSSPRMRGTRSLTR